MSLKSLSADTLEAGLIATCDEAAKVEIEAETALTNVRIRGPQKQYGSAVVAAIAARERSWNAQKALKSYRAGKAG